MISRVRPIWLGHLASSDKLRQIKRRILSICLIFRALFQCIYDRAAARSAWERHERSLKLGLHLLRVCSAAARWKEFSDIQDSVSLSHLQSTSRMHLSSRVSASASIKGTGFFLAKLEFPQLLELVQICSFFARVKQFVLSCCFSANPKYNYCAVQKRVNLVDLVKSFHTST